MPGEQKDKTLSPYYEIHDFPVPDITVEDERCVIDWHTFEETDLSKRLEDGISLGAVDRVAVANDFDNLKWLYGYPDAQQLWEPQPDGSYSLRQIFNLSGYTGIDAYFWGGKDDHRGTPMDAMLNPKNRIFVEDLGGLKQAVFLTECIAMYYEKLGIRFPSIKASFVKTEEIKRWGVKKEVNRLAYSFQIPQVDADYHEIMTIYMQNIERKNFGIKEINNDIVVSENNNIVTSQLNSKGEKVWVADRIPSILDAVRLFSLLSRPLKLNYVPQE